jgi:hypothetical protein
MNDQDGHFVNPDVKVQLVNHEIVVCGSLTIRHREEDHKVVVSVTDTLWNEDFTNEYTGEEALGVIYTALRRLAYRHNFTEPQDLDGNLVVPTKVQKPTL